MKKESININLLYLKIWSDINDHWLFSYYEVQLDYKRDEVWRDDIIEKVGRKERKKKLEKKGEKGRKENWKAGEVLTRMMIEQIINCNDNFEFFGTCIC